MSRGKRYDEDPKLNLKKVAATIIAILVFVMIIISLKKILSPENREKIFIQDVAYFPVYEDGKWGVINSSGEKLDKITHDEMIIIPDNKADVFILPYDINYDEETYKTKVLNSKGSEIFSGYGNVEPLENTNGTKTWYEKNVLRYKSNNKYGLIDYKGKEVLKAEYDNIYPLSGIESCLIIEKEDKKGLFNTAMEEVIIEPEYKNITSLSSTYQNGYIVTNKDDKAGLIGSDKSKILTCQYDEIKNVSGNNYYVVVENGVLEIINSYGKVVLAEGFDSIEAIELDNFIIKKDNKYGLIDKEGKAIIPLEYDDLKFAITDYYIAKKGDKYGIINKNREAVVEYNYNSINYIKEADFYIAEKEDYTTDIIDRSFNVALNGIIISDLDLDQGYLRVRQNNDYHYYNFKFEEKTNKDILTKNTLFIVKENGKYGYENKEGKRIVDCIYDDAKEQNAYGYCVVNQNGLWGVLKSDGTIILEPSVDLADYVYIDFIGQWHRFNDENLYAYTK